MFSFVAYYLFSTRDEKLVEVTHRLGFSLLSIQWKAIVFSSDGEIAQRVVLTSLLLILFQEPFPGIENAFKSTQTGFCDYLKEIDKL